MGQIAAIDGMWGVGTALLMENTARQYPSIKGTMLETVEFRLSLEKYFKHLINALTIGAAGPEECRETAWTDWGMPLTLNKGGTHNEEQGY